MKEYARQCSVTGEGMNEGWVFGDGVFYTKYEKDALAECRKDRDAILHDIETLTAEDIQDPYTWDEFATARQSALQNVEDDHELMTIAFQTDYCYYTEWEDEDDFQYEETPVNASAEFLRSMVAWMNRRPETLNDGKTINQLIMDYKNSEQ